MEKIFDHVPDNNGDAHLCDADSSAARRDHALGRHRVPLVLKFQHSAIYLEVTRPDLTTNDIRANVSIPDGIRLQVVGAAVRKLAADGCVRQVGYPSTTRPEAHCRPLAVWTLADRAAEVAWLAAHPASDPARSQDGGPGQ